MRQTDHRAVFLEEARELLADLEAALLELEESPGDEEIIGRAFRALHTIKGSAAMFGFDAVAAFTHELETVFDGVRAGKVPVSRELVGLTLSSEDHIRSLLDARDDDSEEHGDRGAGLLSRLKHLVPAAGPDSSGGSPSSVHEEPEGGGTSDTATYRIRFKPARDIFQTGTNPILLLNELRGFGRCNVIAQTDRIPRLDALDPEACHLYWDIVLTTEREENAVRDVFIFVEDHCTLSIDRIDRHPHTDPDQPEGDGDPHHRKLGEILVERGDLDAGILQSTLSTRKRIGEMLMDSGVVDPGLVESALAEQEHLKMVRKERTAAEASTTLRVPAEKLDTLVNLVGELVTVQARLSQTALRHDNPELLSIAEEVERLTAELRDNTMSIRMVPMGTTFGKFRRFVRDLSQELGKDVVLTTEGAETELDKTVIERLNDPLVHLIRNCIDHGIEAPERRVAAGKPRQGTVHISAVHSGASVLLTIRDDGAGMDRDAIRAKAEEKGLIGPDSEIGDKELFNLVFMPGFSTARKTTSISGRGVGMDVVKGSIDALRGGIDIESQKGFGTTITLKIPLTLAIIDGLLVRIDDASFVLPLSIVEECVELTREDVARAHGRSLAHVRGEIVPYVRLRERFLMDGAPPDIEQIVIAGIGGAKMGFVVDKVVGEHQTVIKNLSKVFQNVEGVSGATILGDGTVALILDAARLLEEAERQDGSAYQASPPN